MKIIVLTILKLYKMVVVIFRCDEKTGYGMFINY